MQPKWLRDDCAHPMSCLPKRREKLLGLFAGTLLLNIDVTQCINFNDKFFKKATIFFILIYFAFPDHFISFPQFPSIL